MKRDEGELDEGREERNEGGWKDEIDKGQSNYVLYRFQFEMRRLTNPPQSPPLRESPRTVTVQVVWEGEAPAEP